MVNRPFPIEKYHFYQAGNKIIAVSTYCKKPVRGIAICDDTDNFNIDTGKKLAAARCNEKVAEKRLKRAGTKFKEAELEYERAKTNLEKMREYLNDSIIGYNEAAIETDILIKNLKGIN